tara:strand:- start:2 stop:217 length:216 start_codon:yes stop_codon:yes gene_type:complete
VGKENKIKMKSTFQDLNFTDIFEAMDEEYLEELALTDPKQLQRMCVFLTLDAQIQKESLIATKINKNTILA